MIQLKAITAQNWKAVAQLELKPDQLGFVPSNLYSIAEAQFYKEAQSKAIYADDELVGYTLYGRDYATLECKLFRLMIAKDYQGRGYAKLAIKEVIKDLKQRFKAKRVFLSYQVDNELAKTLYKRLGFIEKGLNELGRREAVLEL